MNVPVSGQLERVAWAARLCGGISVGLGVLLCAAALVAMSAREKGVAAGPTALYFGAMLGLYLLPGALLLWLGGKLDAGAYWAFFPIAALTVIDFVELVFSLGLFGLLLGLALRLPTLYLVACCINGWSDVRDHYRERRRKGQRRGFEPVPLPPTANVRPPPPAGVELKSKQQA